MRLSMIVFSPFIIVSALTIGSGVALAAECNPRNFLSSDLSNSRSAQRLVLLSHMTSEQYKESQANHKGKMTIPYIDMPIEGSFDLMKKRTDQLKKLLFVVSSAEAEETIMRVGLTEAGVKGYLGCIGALHVELSFPPEEIFAKDATVTLRFRSLMGEVGEIDQLPELRNGKFTNSNRWKKRLRDNESTFFSIERENVFLPTSFNISINGEAAGIILPPKPSQELVINTMLFPPRGEPPLSTTSDNSTNYGPGINNAEFSAPPNSQFVVGTAQVADEVIKDPGGIAKMSIESADEYRVHLRAYADTGTKDYGSYVEGRASVLVVKAVKVVD